MIEVSVVIPTLNEEKTIGICIDKINKIFDKLMGVLKCIY